MKNVELNRKNYLVFMLFVFLLTITTNSLTAQSTISVEQKQRAKSKFLDRISKYEQNDFRKFHSRLPKANPIELGLHSFKKTLLFSAKEDEKTLSEQLPSNIRTPAETEEVQAIFLAWPMYAYDGDGNEVDPISNNVGFKMLSNEEYVRIIEFLRNNPSKEDSVLASLHVEITSYTPDVFPNSPYSSLWAQLADAIQQEVPVWIRIHSAQDSIDIKNFCLSQNKPLTNYRFFVIPQGGNSFWARDFTPLGFYYGDQDSLAFIDFTYYPGRANDDSLGVYLLPQLGYKVFQTSLMNEGGNFFTDGSNRILTSSAVIESNAQNEGQVFDLRPNTNPVYRFRSPLNSSQIRDTMRRLFGVDSVNILQRLQHDGGTGHLDLYLRQLDEERFMTTDFPDVFNNQQFPDFNRVRNNIRVLGTMNGPYGRTYEFPTIPLPTNDDGSYSTRGTDYTQDARNYINGIQVNKTLIFPTYSNTTTGNSALDKVAVDYYQKAMPGYKIVPIDSRLLSPGGGALHCVTMQIPAENPLRIEFAPVRGTFPITMQQYDITSRITNRSGIKVANFVWRKKGDSQWQEIALTNDGSSNFAGQLALQQFAENDEIEYYIHAESNNGKSMNKPMSAPDGFYTAKIGNVTSVKNPESFDKIATFAVYPNPISSNATIEITTSQSMNTTVDVIDNLGNVVAIIFNGTVEKGTQFIPIQANSLATGMYYIRILSNEKRSLLPISILR
jgi:agmatine/peptidylarginine deiminase